MEAKDVFAPHWRGMEQALSPLGEAVVQKRIDAQNELIQELEAKGMRVDLISRTRLKEQGFAPDSTCEASEIADDPCEEAISEECIDSLETALKYIEQQKQQLAEAQAQMQHLEAEVEHYRYKLDLESSKMELLQNAWKELHSSKNEQES